MEKDTKKRIIKFRGKSIYGEDWLYGSLVKIENDMYAVIPPLNDIEIGKSINMYEVFPETVGQLTGKTDKNKKEIYEGDIVRVYSRGRYFDIVLKWDNYSTAFMACYVDGNKSPFSWFTNLITYELEVIGNVFDNKDLLKKE